MFEVFSIEAADARLRIKRAENSLKRANELLDEEAGVALNLLAAYSNFGAVL